MKWHQRITSSIKMAAKGAASGWKGAGYDFSNWFGRTFWGIDNSKLATNETIFSVVSRLANTMSALPLKLHRNYSIDMDHPSADVLINSPNPNMSGFELINILEVSRNETGNGYAVIGRDIRMQAESITPLDSSHVTPFINNDDGNLWYEVRVSSGTYYFHNMNMLHVKHISGPSRWTGISPIAVLKNTLEYDKAVQEFSLSEMQKKDSFILQYGANVSPEMREKIIADFRRFYKENGGILFQEPGVTVQEMDRKYFASDTLASEKITRSRVANVYNVPSSFLNDEGQSYASNEQTMIQFVQMKLTPDVRQYEHEFNRKLLTSSDRKQGLYFKFNLGGLLRGDTAARTAFYQMMIRSSGMKPNEVRRLEDLPPDESPMAEQLWISGDLYPIDLPISERKSSATTSSTVEGGEQK